MHRGVCAVELAEKEVDGFLRSLSKELREQADELFGKLAVPMRYRVSFSVVRSAVLTGRAAPGPLWGTR